MPDETLENKRIDQLPQSAGITPGSYLAMWNAELGRTERIETAEFSTSTSTNNFEWLSDEAYLEDDVVTFGGLWYQALIDNTNIVPGTDPATWFAIVKSPTGLVPWSAGVFTEEKVFIMYDMNQDDSNPDWGLYALKNPPTRPFVSSDFEVELLAGYWAPASGIDSVAFVDITGDPYDNAAIKAKARRKRDVAAADVIVQADDNGVIYFNSATAMNFTLNTLEINSKTSFVNINAGVVTFINGTGVALVGNPTLPGSAGTNYPSAVVIYDTATAPRIINGSDDDTIHYGVATGTDTYAVVLDPVIAALVPGLEIAVKFTNASTGNSTLDASSLGAKKMYKDPTTQIGNGDITAGMTYEFIYDAALDSAAGGWMRQGAGGDGGSTTDASTTVKGVFEASTDAETIAGTTTGGTGALLAVGPGNLAAWWTNIKTLAHTWTLAQTFTIGPTVSDATASTLAWFNASKKLVTAVVTDVLDWLGINPITVTVTPSATSGGTATLDFNSKYSRKFRSTSANALTGNTTVTKTNATSGEYGHYIFYENTATSFYLQLDSDDRMPDDTPGWDLSTKRLTIVGNSVANARQLGYTKNDTTWIVTISDRITI